ncbi:transcriptional regulator [Streptomyces bambusae]|uniref:Transcriptional regulator n=1 Tax=Streptomyces bambusae TaxID=1550616 RepID=A0ABS6ZH42_9ACTN|nr:transcriptional regulator [Streptomyces bambusae]
MPVPQAARMPETVPTAEPLARRLFRCLPRTDQRRWAGAYLSGLVTTPGKKSVRNMARSAGTFETASQSLHQIVNSSTWQWDPVRRELAAWCGERADVRALRMVPVVIPKRGECSAGVHRRFDPAGGRTLSCQLALGLFLVTDRGTVPVDWRLSLPGRWSEDDELRERARIPVGARSGLPSRLVLDLADTAAAHPATAGVPIVAEAEAETPEEAARIIAGLAERDLGFAVSVPAAMPVLCGPPGARAVRFRRAARARDRPARVGGVRGVLGLVGGCHGDKSPPPAARTAPGSRDRQRTFTAGGPGRPSPNRPRATRPWSPSPRPAPGAPYVRRARS